MTVIAAENDLSTSRTPGSGDERYTRVAIYLHWIIATLILWNLLSGFLIWDLARDFFKANRPLYGIGITLHLSSGMTVLALTVVRIAWRLMHEPPAHAPDMRPWERHAAHFAHFLLYAGMALMPLTGWAILSAHPPAGSPGALVAPSPMASGPMASAQSAPATPSPGGRKMQPPGIWWIIPLPTIAPIADIGREPGGVAPQHKLHEDLVEWHEIGAYLMLALFALHVAGALKHQILDRQPELQRMGWRKSKSRR
ncbi:cytochrome b [Novosphingobium sp. FKTRR1]|uniref:cytochrome b n=1 Tax=Novosphingobium sp. FKTRR1 TaxID=2879118 RepID=UPI001CF044A5|nr:cytochrome b [Novosphingobium sp. FKTRR1]